MKLTTLLFGLALLLSPVLTPLSAQAEQAQDQQPDMFVTLTGHAVVQDGTIRLGEIFQGAGEHADRVVAYAPRPGARAVFDARWLVRVAKAFKLNWRPASANERMVVERAAQVVHGEEIAALLYDRLVAEGGDPGSRVALSNTNLRLNIAVGEDILLGVEQMSYDPTRGRFSATVAWGSGANDRTRVTGSFERMTDVPVLSTRKMRGDLISEDDLDWISMPEKKLSRTAITDVDRLIGMAAKRAISANRPVNTGDIRRPLMVNKGENVTVMLDTPTMQLTAKGRALMPGSKGDVIRISNLQTNTVIEATVIGPGQARVSGSVNLAMR